MEERWKELSDTLLRESDRLDGLSDLLEEIPEILSHDPHRIPELLGRLGEEELALYHVREAHVALQDHLRLPSVGGSVSPQSVLSVAPEGVHGALRRWNHARVRLQGMTLRAAIHLRRFALVNRRMLEHLQNLLPRNYSAQGWEKAPQAQGRHLLMEA